MNQATDTASETAVGARAPALTVIVVTPQSTVFETVHQALASRDGHYETLQVDDPAELASDPGDRAVLYCLQPAQDVETARRELALLRNLAGDTPILLLATPDDVLDVDAALAAGATDIAKLDDRAMLNHLLGRALENGRQRLELQDLSQRLNQTQRRLDVLLSQGQDARASLAGHRVVDASAAFARLLGINDIKAVKGRNLVEYAVKHEREQLAEAIDQVARDHGDTSLVFDLMGRDNDQPQSVRALLQPGVDQNAGEARVNVVLQTLAGGRMTDYARQPSFDGRMALHAVLAQAAGRTQERVLGLVFLAIDEISSLQDQMGLAQSDLLLQEVGLFLLQSMRGEDRVFRFGAGEYVMLMERHSRSEIAESAERLHAALSDEIFGDEHRSATLAASMTHITLTGDVADNDRRLQSVMDAAYDLREDGGNACRDCDEAGAGGAPDQANLQQWTARLRQALTQDRFSLAYQGITSLAGDSQPYFDCLLRYVDDRGALVRPGEFLAAAESADLMPEIDRWVTRRAMDVIRQQQARNANIALFVKLSSVTLGAGEPFLAWLKDTLAAHPVPHHQIIFSMREDEIRAQTQGARRLASALDEMGFRIALTHYGSTAKAAQVLDRMPAAFIKLAPGFARQMLGSEDDERLARIITTARERQIPLIAEQIEDANSMARLWQAGVNYVQGHFIQEPDTEALAHGDSLTI